MDGPAVVGYLQFHYKINSVSVVVDVEQLNDILVLEPGGSIEPGQLS